MADLVQDFQNILAKTKNKLRLAGTSKEKSGQVKVKVRDDYDTYDLTLKDNGDIIYTNDNVKLGNLYQDEDSLVARLQEGKLNEMSGTGGGVGGGSFTPGTGDGVATKKAFGRIKKKKRNPYKLSNLMTEIQISRPLTPAHLRALEFLDSTFEGEEVPEELKNLVKSYKKIDKKAFKNIWSQTLQFSSSGDYGADWDFFDVTAKWVLTGEWDDDMMENLNESLTYSKFKNEVKTRTKQQQLHRSIKEVQKRLNEINKVLEYTNRMRNELNENGDNIKYTRFTEQALKQIKEMTVNLYKNIKELKK